LNNLVPVLVADEQIINAIYCQNCAPPTTNLLPVGLGLSRKVLLCPVLSAEVQLVSFAYRARRFPPLCIPRLSKAIPPSSKTSQASRFQACSKKFFKIHLTKSQSWFIIQAIEKLKSHEPSGICNGEYPRERTRVHRHHEIEARGSRVSMQIAERVRKTQPFTGILPLLRR